MNAKEMQEVFKELMAVYRFMDFSNEATSELWFDALKGYELGEVKAAIRTWTRFSSAEPTIHDILEATRNVRITRSDITQNYVDWRSVASVRCPKCNDHGYIEVVYPNDYTEMRVCNCETARQRYGFAFTDEFARKCEKIAEREEHPDVRWNSIKYAFGIVTKDKKDDEAQKAVWLKRKRREIKNVTKGGLVQMRVELV